MSDEGSPSEAPRPWQGGSVPPRVCGHAECDAPADTAWEYTSRSSGGITPGARVVCAAGHWYSWYGDEVLDPFITGPRSYDLLDGS
jgi:hypothetical protein